MTEYLTKKTQRKRFRRKRAHHRVRNGMWGTPERPRLAVFKSKRHIYAQVIDDEAGRTLAQASTLDPGVSGELEGSTGSVAAAEVVGKTVADRAKENGIERVVFDRGGFVYHGKIKAIADSAREHGLKF